MIEGGASRADSVRNALGHLSARHDPRTTGVLLHDAARPLVDPGVIEALRRGPATA